MKKASKTATTGKRGSGLKKKSAPAAGVAKVAKSAIARDQYFSRAVSKALQIVELLQVSSHPLSLAEITQKIQLSKTSAFRLLRTLETSGYLTLDGRGQYKLAPGTHAVTPTHWVGKLLRVGVPYLYSLNRDFSETATLAALFENRIEVVAVVESTHAIRMSNVVGHILPPNASSLGKVITAFQPSAQTERLLRSFKIYRFTDHTITDQKDLVREYEKIREQQYAVDREECSYDGVCFSVPVFGEAGGVSAALSISLPKSRLRNSQHEKTMLAALRSAADKLANDLLD